MNKSFYTLAGLALHKVDSGSISSTSYGPQILIRSNHWLQSQEQTLSTTRSDPKANEKIFNKILAWVRAIAQWVGHLPRTWLTRFDPPHFVWSPSLPELIFEQRAKRTSLGQLGVAQKNKLKKLLKGPLDIFSPKPNSSLPHKLTECCLHARYYFRNI